MNSNGDEHCKNEQINFLLSVTLKEYQIVLVMIQRTIAGDSPEKKNAELIKISCFYRMWKGALNRYFYFLLKITT